MAVLDIRPISHSSKAKLTIQLILKEYTLFILPVVTQFCFTLARVYNMCCLYVDKLVLALGTLSLQFFFHLILLPSSILSPFIHFINELSEETEGHSISCDLVLGLGENLFWKPTVSFPLLNFPFSLCVPPPPHPRYSTSSLPCCSIPLAMRREMETWMESPKKPKSS